MKTIEELDNLLEQIEELQERAAKIATAMIKLKGFKGSIDSYEISFDDGTISASYEEYIGCGNYETHELDIPHKYFFDENFIDSAREEIRKKKEAEEERKRIAAEKRKAIEEERELQKYRKLKMKFEGTIG